MNSVLEQIELPLVTVGIPNYNYAGFLRLALDSVARQTYNNIELVIVDDGSTDNSVAIIENWIKEYTGNFKISFIKNKQSIGIARVCNLILKNISGKYYQVLDADDILLPNKIESQVPVLEKNGEIALAYSNISVINEQGKVINDNYLKRVGYDAEIMPTGNVFNELLLFNFIPNPSVLIRTACAIKIGGYDESLQVQDYYLYLTLSEQYNFIYSKEVTASYRVHETSLSNNNQTNAKSFEGVLQLLSRYYDKGNATFRASFAKSIFNMAPYFYKHRYPSARYWLKRNVLLNPGLKSIGYYIANKLGVPYILFEKIKMIRHTNKSDSVI